MKRNNSATKDNKKKVLVFGLAANIGGTESVFKALYDGFDKSKYHFDFIAREDKIAFQDEYESDGSMVFIPPSLTKHPIKYYHTVKSILKDGNYRIVHLNMLTAANIIPIIAAKKERVPCIVAHSHNDGTRGLMRKMLHYFGKKYLKKQSLIRIACSDKAGSFMFGTKNYTIINNPFDPASFKYNKTSRKEIREQNNIPDDAILLGNIGRLEKQKNPLFLIDVLAEIKKTTSLDYRLMFVGEGKLRNAILKRAEKLGVSDSIILVGRVNNANDYYSAIDLFVMPSKFEGFGMVALEAQASGLPCVFSDKVPSAVDILNTKHLALEVSDWAKYILSVSKHRLTAKPGLFDKFGIKNGATSLAQIYKKNTTDSSIDFVVMWVDPNDPEWQKEKAKYTPEKNTDSSARRYRDWDNLQYWFRGVEKYAPWVNKVYFVTFGHVPKWLNVNHPKLEIVKHTDFIPKKYLPTFSANPIEMNVHRIKGLSENFVFFNDDLFLVNHTKPTDFFVNNLPCDSACMYVNIPAGNVVDSLFNNDMQIINAHFPIRETLKKNLWKWYNVKNGKYLYNNIALSVYGGFVGIHFLHLPNSFKKSTFEKIWTCEPETLNGTCLNKFRSANDVNQWLVKYWQICEGKFVPRKVGWGKYYEFDMGYDELRKIVAGKKYKVVCVNDTVEDEEFENAKIITKEIFERKLPDKSEFEL